MSSPDATGKIGADVEMDNGVAAQLSSLPRVLETALWAFTFFAVASLSRRVFTFTFLDPAEGMVAKNKRRGQTEGNCVGVMTHSYPPFYNQSTTHATVWETSY